MMLQIHDAASYLGVCNKTLCRWESRGYILPQRTQGYHCRYDSDALIQFQKTGIYEVNSRSQTHIGAIYARVSGQKQKEDLTRQRDLLISEVLLQHLTPKIYQDIGSGLNDHRQGLERLIKDALAHKFDSVYVTYLERFSRFGSHLLRLILSEIGIPMVILAPAAPPPSHEAELVQDVLGIGYFIFGKITPHAPWTTIKQPSLSINKLRI